MDNIAKTYISMKLNEMAFEIGGSTNNSLNDFKNRKSNYHANINIKPHKTLDNGMRVLKKIYDNGIEYHTVDDVKRECVHQAVIKQIPGEGALKDSFEYQHSVSRDEANTDLPKGHATNVIYDHFLNSNLPLRSSGSQFPGGHKMWGRLVDKALDDGHHAYYINRYSMTKLNKDNKDEYHKKYFGKTMDKQNEHLVISKKELS